MTTISRQTASLPHTGIATFSKSPYVFGPELMDANVEILGVPSDTWSMQPGCRQAPRALRDASTRFGWPGSPIDSLGFFDIRNNTTFLSGIRMVNAADIDVRFDAPEACNRITKHAHEIVDRGPLLASIGGDHSVNFPLIAAFEKSNPLSIVLLDAHLYRDFNGRLPGRLPLASAPNSVRPPMGATNDM